jgi:hypothetical protein
VPTLITGTINAQKIPTNDCLYIPKKSLLNNWNVSHLLFLNSENISMIIDRCPFFNELSGS